MSTKQIILTGLFMLCCLSGYSQSVSFSRTRTHLSKKQINARVKDATEKRDELNNLKQFSGRMAPDSVAKRSLHANVDFTKTIPGDDAMKSEVDAQNELISKLKSQTRKGLKDTIAMLKRLRDAEISRIKGNTEDSIIIFEKKYLLKSDTVEKYSNTQLDNAQDSAEAIKSSTRSVIQALREISNSRILFPAIYARESIAFFTEKDTLASKFFADNSLLYNSSLQKLTYGSEAYSDYFGPVRVGLGYTITSSSNTKDTSKTQSDAIQKVITNGGNINYNVSFPLLTWSAGNTLGVKASLSTKGGVDIPKDSASTSTYGYLTTSGLNVNAYSIGVLGVIQLFGTSRIAYVLGNKAFEEHVGQNSFWLWQNSIGVAVKDKFRIRLDMYSGLSGSANAQFVRSNFPVTMSFDIINPF